MLNSKRSNVRPDSNGESSQTPLSVNERLHLARSTHLRHLRNERARAAKSESQDEDGQDDAGHDEEASSSAAPLQSHAGVAFLQRTSLMTLEEERQRTNTAVRRRVSGPAPPRSWAGEFTRPRRGPNAIGKPSHRSGTGNAGEEHGDGTSPSQHQHLRQRARKILAVTRRLFAYSGNAVVSTLPSLRDEVLRYIADALTCPSSVLYDLSSDDQVEVQAFFKEQLSSLPVHIKERLVALTGREARTTYSMDDETLSALWSFGPTDREDMREKEYADITEEDDWDTSVDVDRRDRRNSDAATSRRHSDLDLSFAKVSLRALSLYLFGVSSKIPRELAAQQNLHLRTLSLAGWQAIRAGEHGLPVAADRGVHCSADALVALLSACPSLRTLCLPSSSLASPSSALGPRLSAPLNLKAPLFIRRLSRATANLVHLDLSYTDWIDGSALAAVRWSKRARSIDRDSRTEVDGFDDDSSNVQSDRSSEEQAWPNLEVLALHGCSLFRSLPHSVIREEALEGSVSKSATEDQPLDRQEASVSDPLGEPAGVFVDTWHKAHAASTSAPLRSLRASEALSMPLLDGSGLFSFSAGLRPSAAAIARANSSYPTRCAITKRRVERWEWERARVLDAVRGRGDGGQRQWVEVYFG